MNVIDKHDIIIVGAGAAGLRAAIEIAEINPKISIALISKVYPTRSHTVAAEGGIAAVIGANDTIEKHIEDTIIGSDYIADQDAVEFFAKRCKNEIETLNQWGCPWSRTEDGKIAVRAFGGMSEKRTVHAADRTGFYILHNLFERSLLHESITKYDEWFITKLFTNEKGIQGLAAINQKDGELVGFSANTIILATGGAGQIYHNTSTSAIKTGDGIALAFNEGALLKDMEFIQFHPTTIPGCGILISEAARGEGGYLRNKNGDRFLNEYTPAMELASRDIISRSIIEEFHKGNGFKGPHGNYIHLDLTHLGEKDINEKLPHIKDLALKFLEIDPIKKPLPVTPAQHYFMGGIHTNTKGETSIPGLYAIGETACISISGANRLGSNSLAKCLVFGTETGKHIAKNYNNSKKANLEKETEQEDKKIKTALNPTKKENPYHLVQEMKNTMDEAAGIIRSQKTLQQGLEKIRSIRAKTDNIKIKQQNLIFNAELTTTLELQNMLSISETVLISALERKETRGAHFRKDFQERDNKHYLHHTLISNDYKTKTIPVTITKWQPPTNSV